MNESHDKTRNTGLLYVWAQFGHVWAQSPDLSFTFVARIHNTLPLKCIQLKKDPRLTDLGTFGHNNFYGGEGPFRFSIPNHESIIINH